MRSAILSTTEIAALADSLASVLRHEFGVSFAFIDVASGESIRTLETGQELSVAVVGAVREQARTGEPCVRPLADGDYQLELPIFQDQEVVLAACGRMVPLARHDDLYNVAREKHNLQRWLKAVGDRLRAGAAASFWDISPPPNSEQRATAWDALLTASNVLRRLRIYREPPRNVQMILDAAQPLVEAEVLIWLPKQLDIPGTIRGKTTLTLADCRDLLNALAKEAAFSPPRPFICNEAAATPWGQWFPNIRSTLILQAMEQEPLGWLIAINHAADAGFRKTHAAILAPFLSMLVFYGKTLIRFQELKELLVGLTRSLTVAMDAKDPATLGHSERVARIAVEIGRRLGMSATELGDVYLTGLLHDIGKIGVKDEILFKPGALTPDEYDQVKEHVSIGYAILSDLRSIHNLLPGVLYHHENFDGTGYPDGLQGEQIPLLARILAVADAYDSMSNELSYRDALSCAQVEARLQAGAGTQWDPQIVAALLEGRQVVHAIRQCGAGESLRVAMNNALQSRRGTTTLEDLTPPPPTRSMESSWPMVQIS